MNKSINDEKWGTRIANPRERENTDASDENPYISSIYNSIGELLETKMIVNTFNELNLNVFSNGVYYFKFQNQELNHFKKVVINE